MESEKGRNKEVTNTGASQVKYDQTNVRQYIYNVNGLKRDIETMSKFRHRKTGFSNLDMEIKGIPPAMYLIMAKTSVGKTSFATQMACNFAAGGEYVMYISIEPKRVELVSKCISRETALATINSNAAFSHAVSAKYIGDGAITDEVKTAMKTFVKKIDDRLYIIDESDMGDVLMTSKNITSYISRWIKKHNGVVPIVFIDYLQYIPHDLKSSPSERSAVDHDIAILKRYQKEHSLALFLISSIGRTSYNTSVSLESSKESGNIEYSGDFVWGLQLDVISSDQYRKANIEDRKKLEREAMEEIPRKIKLISLKCRNGNANFECDFKYFPVFDLFIPDTEFCPVFENEYTPFDEDGEQISFDF